MQPYILTEEEAKNRPALSRVARKYITMNSWELSQALISLGSNIALRGHKEASDDLEAKAILLNLMDAFLSEKEVGRISINKDEEEPVKVYRLKKKLSVPDGNYSLIPIHYEEEEE